MADPVEIPVAPDAPFPDPCPFCGSDKLGCLAARNMIEELEFAIQCQVDHCKAIGPFGKPSKTPEEAERLAIAAWNQRVSFSSLAARSGSGASGVVEVSPLDVIDNGVTLIGQGI
jgi:hypothetical protein